MSVTKITLRTVTLAEGEELELKYGEKLLEQKIIIERVDEGALSRLFKRSAYMPEYKVVCLLQCFQYDDRDEEGRKIEQ